MVRGGEGILRVVATDLDGTLLRSDGSVSNRTRSALRIAQEAGVTVVLVTARGVWSMPRIAHETGMRGLAICSNGAILFDLDEERVVWLRTLASDVAVRIVEALRKRLPGVLFATELDEGLALEPGFTAWGWTPPADTRYDDALALVATPVAKLIARPVGHSLEQLADAAREVAGESAVAVASGPWVVEITAAGVNKANALEKLSRELGVSADQVLAFGDYPNDLPMLAWAGRSVAPANAHPDVLAAVDEVTSSNDEDGVAIVLERLFDQ